MDEQQSAAFVFASAVAAMCELEAMKVANRQRESQGLAPVYGEEAFNELIIKHGIGCNDVRFLFSEVNHYR